MRELNFQPTIAVVDRDESILDAVRLMLEDHGWDMRSYLDAGALLDDVREGRSSDLLLLEPHLTGTTGLDVVRTLAGRGVPVVVFSIRPHSALVEVMKRIGVEAVLSKPVDGDVLVAMLRRVLSARRSQEGTD